jgi:hypothetical protein
VLDIDARYTSPMKLHDFVIMKGWDYVGAAFVSDSGLQAVDSGGQVMS